MNTQTQFEDAFARALLCGEAPRESALASQPAFAVYRNTVLKGCIDALEANYPAVVRLVGLDWFRSAAALFVRAQPPRDSALFDYGRGLPDFLRDLESAAALPYLPDVARLDRFWTEAHVAADAPPLGAARLAKLPAHELTNCRLLPHPAARWAWFAEQPIYSIWRRNRDASLEEEPLVWHGEGALLTRPADTVGWQEAHRADCAFLDACADGCLLGDAAERAQLANPQADLVSMLARLLQAGALVLQDCPKGVFE